MSKKELIEQALRESKDFAKQIRKYLYEQSQTRELSDEELELFNATHDVHIHTNDSIMLLAEL